MRHTADNKTIDFIERTTGTHISPLKAAEPFGDIKPDALVITATKRK